MSNEFGTSVPEDQAEMGTSNENEVRKINLVLTPEEVKLLISALSSYNYGEHSDEKKEEELRLLLEKLGWEPESNL